MALMFRRLARNYAKAGYFPTDDESVERVTHLLTMGSTKAGPIRVLDPTAGEGAALADVAHHLHANGADVKSYGIEYDVTRAEAATDVLDVCLQADIQDCKLEQQGFGLLFLNPPYGDTASDGRSTGDREEKRLEHLICRRTFSSLQFGGVLVLILPHYSLKDPGFAGSLARSFDDIRIFPAGVSDFKQMILMGVKRRSVATGSQPVRDWLIGIGRGEIPVPTWEDCNRSPYVVPAASTANEPLLMSFRIDRKQLAAEIGKHGGLWPQAEALLGSTRSLRKPRPLRKPSNWHLALMLAAGQVNGVIESADGRRWLVKGDTRKDQVRKASTEIVPTAGGGEEVVETITVTDRFVPTITAIDLTPGESLGSIIHIGGNP